MRTKPWLTVARVFALLFCTSFALIWTTSRLATRLPNETRREAIVETLSEMQASNGSFVGSYQMANYDVISGTSIDLNTLACLNSLDRVDSEKAVDYIVTSQNTTTGGFPDRYLTYGELGTPWVATSTLKSVNSSSRLHRSLVDFVAQRYNATEGAFHEPTFEPNVKKVINCHFNMIFHGNSEAWTAYAKNNVISTFLATDILRNLGALDRINITKTVGWILSCMTDNGGFGPFPNPRGEPYAPYWADNPFTVDSYGAGVAYTYAALGALNALDGIDSLTPEQKEQAIDYVLSCQHARGCFVSIPEYATGPVEITPEDDNTFFTYYAIMALQYLNAMSRAEEQVTGAESWLLSQQDLGNTDPSTYGLAYGLSPEGGARDIVLCLNASGRLHLLEALTPRALQQRFMIISTSTASALATFLIVIAVPSIVKRIRKPQQHEGKGESENTSTV